MVRNVMTDVFKIKEDETRNLENDVEGQISVRQKALEEIDRAKFGWYHIR